MIRTAKIIKIDSKEDEVGLFDEVIVEYDDTKDVETVRLSTTTRLDPMNKIYSKDCPFGKAIFGKKVGDVVRVSIADGSFYYVKILAIKKGTGDDSIALNSY